jgi:hypothetical protein
MVPAAICLGIAGVDRPDDYAVVGAIMRRIGHKARIIIVNDALVALEAGLRASPVSSSFQNRVDFHGRNEKGEAARSGGWGSARRRGSGYWIGRAALRAVLRQADRRVRDVLSELLLKHFDVGVPQELIHRVYNTNSRPTAIGALARCVNSAFAQGDGRHRHSPRRGERAETLPCPSRALEPSASHLSSFLPAESSGGALARRGARAPPPGRGS